MQSDSLLGEVLDGKYEILRPLARGGMGAVYVARRCVLGDWVAIKHLLPSRDSERNRARLLREARAAARVRHPSVVQILDYGQLKHGEPYLVMEYVEGLTLEEILIREGRLSPTRALELLSEVCAAVEAAHRRGVLHRDLKARNILVGNSDDGRELVKVLDFGIAHLLGAKDDPRITSTDEWVGTLACTAPERLTGAEATAAADVFSLGVLLYQMVTGQLPFEASHPAALLHKLNSASVHFPPDVEAALPTQMLEAIRAALALDPMARPESALHLGRQAGAALRQATVERARPVRPNWHAFVGRSEELERLGEELTAGERRILVVTGGPGMGKTRLVQQFGAWAADRGSEVRWTRFVGDSGFRPPSLECLLRLLPEESATQLRQQWSRPAHDSRDWGDQEMRWRAFSAVAEQFQRSLSGRRCVLVLDDLHLASRLELDLVTHLCATLPQTTLLVATAESSAPRADSGRDFDRWLLSQQRWVCAVPLMPFAIEQVRAYLSAAFGELRLAPTDMIRIHRASAGAPYALVEIARHLVAEGKICRTRDGWRCVDLEQVHLPENVGNMLRARLSGLPEALRGFLEAAAVIGQEFTLDILRTVAGLDEDELESLLEDAERHQVLAEIKGLRRHYRFQNPTLHSVIYGDLPARRRARLHRRVLEAIRSQLGAQLPSSALALCYHCCAVGEWAEALHHGLRAAEEALRCQDNESAELTLRRAQAASDALREGGTPPSSAAALKLSIFSGTLDSRLGRLRHASELLEHASMEAERLGDWSAQSHALFELAQAQVGLGELADAAQTAQRAAGVAQRVDDWDRERAARVLHATALSRQGRVEEAQAILEALLLEGEWSGSKRIGALALKELACIHLKEGAFEKADAGAKAALQLARASGDRQAEYEALSAIGVVRMESGAAAEALAPLTEALRLSRNLFLRRREAIDLANLGEAYFELASLDQARTLFEEALSIFREIQDRACEGDCTVNIGRVLLAQGQMAAAVSALEKGAELCAQTGRKEYCALAWQCLAQARLQEARLDEAQSLFERAEQLFAQHWPQQLWKAELGLARVAVARSKTEVGLRYAARAAERVQSLKSTLSRMQGAPPHLRGASEPLELLQLLKRPRSFPETAAFAFNGT